MHLCALAVAFTVAGRVVDNWEVTPFWSYFRLTVILPELEHRSSPDRNR